MSKSYHGFANGMVAIEVGSGTMIPLLPRFDLRNHSPTGFSWGYGGSGPAQLALALIADVVGDDPDKIHSAYQCFKREVIACLEQNEPWSLSEEDIRNWLYAWERDVFVACWEYLEDEDQVDAPDGRQYQRVYAAWRKAGAPAGDDLFAWIVAEASLDNHTLII